LETFSKASKMWLIRHQNISLIFFISYSMSPQSPIPLALYTMHALHLGHAQGQAHASKVITLQTSLHPYNLNPPISIQITRLYIYKFDVNFYIGLTHARCSHHGKSQNTHYLSKWTIHCDSKPPCSHNTFFYVYWTMTYECHCSIAYGFGWKFYQWVWFSLGILICVYQG
jgi:hypothetical protein